MSVLGKGNIREVTFRYLRPDGESIVHVNEKLSSIMNRNASLRTDSNAHFRLSVDVKPEGLFFKFTSVNYGSDTSHPDNTPASFSITADELGRDDLSCYIRLSSMSPDHAKLEGMLKKRMEDLLKEKGIVFPNEPMRMYVRQKLLDILCEEIEAALQSHHIRARSPAEKSAPEAVVS